MSTTPEQLCEFILAEARGERVEVVVNSTWVKHREGSWSTSNSYRIAPKPKKKIVLRQAVMKAKNGRHFLTYELYENAQQVAQDYKQSSFIRWHGEPIEVEVEGE